MNDLTVEQLRRIDAAVAECMGLNVVATEWLCLYGNGRFTIEAYRFPDNNEPPYFIFKKGRPSRIETIRPVYVPEDGEYWPPVWYKPEDKDEGYWCADVEPVAEYATRPEAWATVEKFMVEYATESVQRYYVYCLELESDGDRFKMLTAPLPIRCLAFLRAIGEDVDAILKESKHGRSE